MDDLVACLPSIVTLISFGTVIIFIGGVKKTKKVVFRKIFVYRYPNFPHQSGVP